MNYTISPFDNLRHRDLVVALWHTAFGYEAAHNAPGLVIDKKIALDDGLFFVALDDQTVVGTVMAGYDGHRGWIYSLAVDSAHRGRGLGSELLAVAERHLSARGCMKINVQIVAGNNKVEHFYRANGFRTEARISMGKRLPGNIPPTEPGD